MARSFYEILVKLEGEEEVRKGIQDIGVSVGVATAALGALTVKAREAAIEYDSALAKFNTIANEATGTIEQQKQAFAELTTEVKNSVTAAEALNASYEVLSAGYQNLNDVVGIVTLSQKTAVGGFAELGTVTDFVTTALNTYGDTLGEATTVTQKAEEILAQAIAVQNLGKTTVAEYGAAIGDLFPTAKAAGASLSELNAVLAVTTSRGISTSTSVAGFRQLLVNLLRPQQQAQIALREYGVELGAAALQVDGYKKKINQILDIAEKNPAILGQVFGDVESASIARVLLQNRELVDLQEKQIELARQKGVIDAQFNIVSETAAEKQKRLLNLINDAFVDLGIGVVNTLEPLIEALSEAIRVFKEAPPQLKQFVGGLALLVTAAGGVTTAIIAQKFAVQSFNQALIAAKVSASQLAVTLGAVTAAGFVASEIVSTFNTIQNAAKSSEEGIREIQEAIAAFKEEAQSSGGLEEEFDATAFKIQRVREEIQNSLSPFQKFFDRVIEGINLVNSKITNFIDRIPLIPKVVKDALKNTVTLGSFIPKDADGNLTTAAQAAANKINQVFEEALAQSAKTRDTFAKFDFDSAPIQQAELAIKAVIKQRDELSKVKITDPKQQEELDREIALLDKIVKQANKAAEARGLSTKSVTEAGQAAESQTKSEKDLNKELEQQKRILDAKLQTQLRELDRQQKLGKIDRSTAIQRSLEAENQAFDKQIALIDQRLAKEEAQSAKSLELVEQKNSLLAEKEQNLANRQVQLAEETLNEITALRDREIAQVEARGLSEIERTREVFAVKEKFAKQEEAELRKQIDQFAAGSNQRIALETRLFKLQASIASERKSLAEQEKKAIEEQIRKKTEEIDLEARLIKARAGDDTVAVNQAELEALDRKIEALKEIANTEGITDETKKRLTVEIAEAERQRIDINKKISDEVTNRQISGIKSLLDLQKQGIEFDKQVLSAKADFINAQNSLFSTISSGLSNVVAPLQALEDAYDRVGKASQSVADIDRARQEQLRDRALQDITVPEGATEAQKRIIEAENQRRRAIRERIALQREEEEYQRKRREAVEAERKAREELAKKEEEARVANRQRAILEEQLLSLGIRVNRTGDVANDIKEAQIQLQILEITNQQDLNGLKLEQQKLELENLRIQQQAIIAEENLRLQSGTLSQLEVQQAQLRIQLAQNQLAVLQQQEANLDRQNQVTRENFVLQQRLAESRLRNPAVAGDLRGAQRATLSKVETDLARISDPIVGAILRLGSIEEAVSAVGRLESVSSSILTATQQLPNQLARVIPKPVVPR